MTPLRRIVKAVRSPVVSAFRFIANRKPGLLFDRYARLAKKQGFKRACFVLSFDCDTEPDIHVVEEVHDKLAALGITPVYAVPGQMLEKGLEVYRSLSRRGAEFMNHGYQSHCEYDAASRSYVSSFFYDQLPPEIVVEDIRRGHQAHIDLLGKRPFGFRTPHFGSFQEKKHLELLWSVLRDLDYKYSSSTSPLYAFRNGPFKRVNGGLHEIPVSGCYDFPLKILDSWGFRFDPSRDVTEPEYGRQFEKMRRYFSADGGVGLFNIYADPSQVHDWPLFFECMESVASMAVGSYENLLKELGA